MDLKWLWNEENLNKINNINFSLVNSTSEGESYVGKSKTFPEGNSYIQTHGQSFAEEDFKIPVLKTGKQSTMNASHMTKPKVALDHPRYIIWLLHGSSKINRCKIKE